MGQSLAVYDATTGLVVSVASVAERAALDELVRLANVGQWTETAATDTTPAATDDNR